MTSLNLGRSKSALLAFGVAVAASIAFVGCDDNPSLGPGFNLFYSYVQPGAIFDIFTQLLEIP